MESKQLQKTTTTQTLFYYKYLSILHGIICHLLLVNLKPQDSRRLTQNNEVTDVHFQHKPKYYIGEEHGELV